MNRLEFQSKIVIWQNLEKNSLFSSPLRFFHAIFFDVNNAYFGKVYFVGSLFRSLPLKGNTFELSIVQLSEIPQVIA